MSRLVDAIAARAIEDGYLDLPDEEAFWGLFTYGERREIVGALSALGYRFDGLGGFADGRVPAQRDLSLAVGYAGLDRMRVRTWPREAELARLYEHAAVAADDWLVDMADDLSLGRMVDALGARAGGPRRHLERLGPGPAAAPRDGLSPPVVEGSAALGALGSGLVRVRRALVLVVLDDDHAVRLGRLDADRLALVAGPLADPALERVGLLDLARVRPQGGDLAVEASRDVHPRRGLVGPRQVQAAHRPRLEAVAREPRERHRVAGRRVDGVDRGHPRHAVVDVVHAPVVVEDRLRVDRQDRVGPERADLADEELAQREVVGERAVGLVEERHARVADDLRRRLLLRFAERAELERVRPPVVVAGIALRAAHEPARRALVDPAGRRRRRPEVGVVGVGDDHHEPGRAPGVGRGRGLVGHCGSSRGSGQPAWLARASSSASRTCSAWPSAFTLAHVRTTLPSGPTRKLDRPMPMYVLP